MSNREICQKLAELAADENPYEARIMALMRGLNRLAGAQAILQQQLNELVSEAGNP